MNALCYHDKPNIHVKLVFSSLWNHLNESYDHLKSTCKKVSPAFCQAESWLFPPAYPAVSVGRRGGSVSSCREHWCSATSPTCHPIGPVLALYGDWQMGCSSSTEINHHLLGFSCVKWEAAPTASVPEGLTKVPVLVLLSTTDSCHNNCVITVFLHLFKVRCL